MSLIEIKCSGCGALFDKPLKEYNRQNRLRNGAARFYCTSRCSDKARIINTEVSKTCKCGKVFVTKTDSNHCSRRCASFYSLSDTRLEAMLIGSSNTRITSDNCLPSVASRLRSREWKKYEELDGFLLLMEFEYQFEFHLPDTRFIYDLAVFNKRLLIEFDEEYHRYNTKSDDEKDQAAIDQGWEIVRIDVRDFEAPYPEGLIYFLLSNSR